MRLPLTCIFSLFLLIYGEGRLFLVMANPRVA